MALYINDNHILYYHMNTVKFSRSENSCFICPDYLAAEGWIRGILLLS